jgi:hypothetical protein
MSVGLFHLALLGEFARKHHWDFSAMVQASAARVHSPEFAAISRPLPAGHDGQFYYLLAQNPFKPARRDLLDVSARHARMLYPLLGWLLSGGGNQRALIYVLPIINFLAIIGLAWLAASWATWHGRPAAWGLFLPCALVPGIALVHDLSDAVACLALVALVFAYIARRDHCLAPLALATLLAKEQNAAVVGVIILLTLSERRVRAAAGLIVASVLWLGWLGWVWHTYNGESPFLSASDNFTRPCSGLWWRLSHLGQIAETDPVSTRRLLFHLLSTSYQITIAAVGAWLAIRPGPMLERALALGGALLVILASPAIYRGMYDYNRVLVLAPFAVWLTGVRRGQWWMMWTIAPGAFWAIYAAKGWA